MDTENQGMKVHPGTKYQKRKNSPEMLMGNDGEEGTGTTIPKFLPFSGSEPKSSEESGIEEFLFQIKRARLDSKDEAIRIAMLRNSIQHLKGEVMTFGMLLRSAQKVEEERKRIEMSLKETLKNMKEKKLVGKSISIEEQKPENRKRKVTNRELVITSAGPFRGKAKPQQHWRCGGWGHTLRECSTQGSFTWNEEKRKEKKPSSQIEEKEESIQEELEGSPPKRTPSIERAQMKKFKKGVAKCIRQTRLNYYNPDPMVRLIGEANESMVQVNNHMVKALIDSGAQVSTYA